MEDHDESPEDLGAQGVVGGDFGEEFGGGVCCEGPEVDGHSSSMGSAKWLGIDGCGWIIVVATFKGRAFVS